MGLLSKIQFYLIGFIAKKLVLVGVPVIITNKKGQILLGKRSKRIPFYPGYWGLPGGLMERGETPEETAKREVHEELNIKIEITKEGKPFISHPSKECPMQSLDIPLHGKIIGGSPKPCDETSEIKWASPKEIKNMKLAYDHKGLLKQEGVI